MEFKEFSNPEEADYDITSSMYYDEDSSQANIYRDQIFDLIGLLENIDDEEFLKEYGITKDEYMNPTADVVKKLEEKKNGLSSEPRGR